MAAKYPFEEWTRVAWVTTIADIAEPSPTELSAGTDITCYLTKDGLNPGGSTNGIDAGTLCNRVAGQVAGSVSYQAPLKGYRYVAGDDDFWDLCAYGTSGYLVVRRGVAYSDAFAADDVVEVYKAQMGEPIPATSAANAMQTFEVGLFVEDANLKAVVTV